mgnify:FL=1|tara:strand:+ start:1867 stop:2700 length:834 start_codon:yes stop_codon:yes gene_type:complete
MTQQYGGGLTPQQQTQFSDWWLNKKYGGDLNNVEGLYQNETTGNWQADPNQIFDINPETGQKGQFKYMATPAYVGWIDVTEPLFYTITNADGSTFEVEMTRNRHGLYAPEEFLDSSGQRIIFNTNPNTGEEGKWVWLGTMGWTNTEGDPQEPLAPGTPTFGNFGDGSIVGPAGSEVDTSDSTDSTDSTDDSSSSVGSVDETAATENPFEGASASGFSDEASGMSSAGMGFSAPMGLTYSPQQVQESTQMSANVDYVQELNNLLIADVVGNMLTGNKV